MKKNYTAAIVGTGRIGFSLGFDKKREQPASHTMALKQNARIKIVAGVDCNSENLAAWKKSNKAAAAFSSVKEMYVAGKLPDIVVVAVNEAAHLSVTLEVLKHSPRLVILEKPVALNLKEAARIKSAAKKYGVPILVNHERRFANDYNAAADYCKKIGEIQSINARLFSGMKLYDPAAESTGGFSLIHDGTHLVDITLFLLESLSGAAEFSRPLLKEPVITGISFDKKNRRIVRELNAHYSTKVCPDVNIFMSGKSRFFGFEIDVIGTEGRVIVGNGFAKFFRRAESKLYSGFWSLEKDDSVVLPKKCGKIQTGYFANMVQNAVDFLDGSAALKSTLQTGTNALRVLEEIKSTFVPSTLISKL